MVRTLVVYLKAGGTFPLILPSREAEDLYNAWTTRKAALEGRQVFEGQCTDNGLRFAMLFSEVSALLLSAPHYPNQQVQQQPSPYGWGSGRN